MFAIMGQNGVSAARPEMGRVAWKLDHCDFIFDTRNGPVGVVGCDHELSKTDGRKRSGRTSDLNYGVRTWGVRRRSAVSGVLPAGLPMQLRVFHTTNAYLDATRRRFRSQRRESNAMRIRLSNGYNSGEDFDGSSCLR